MAIAPRVEWYLGTHGVHYDLTPHVARSNPSAAAGDAQVAPESVTRSVLLCDEQGYLVAVLPASRALNLPLLSEKLHRQLGRAADTELHHVFIDCDRDSVPPVGVAYGVPTVVDRALFEREDLYLESGDHGSFVHLSRGEFERLMARSKRVAFSVERGTNQAC